MLISKRGGSLPESSVSTLFPNPVDPFLNGRIGLFAKSSIPPYRIVYRLRDGVVEVATIFRASRQFPDFMR